MKSGRHFALPVILTLVMSCSATFADGYVLVTEEEVARSIAAGGINELAERAADPLGPKIDVLRPGDGNKFVSPVDIHITFVPTEGAEIDLETLEIKYGALGLNVTDRVTGNAEVTERGIRSEGAMLPTGKHKLTVYIGDTLGRVGKRRFTFTITD